MVVPPSSISMERFKDGNVELTFIVRVKPN